MTPIDFAAYLRAAAQHAKLLASSQAMPLAECPPQALSTAISRTAVAAERTFTHTCSLCKIEKEQLNQWYRLGISRAIFICNDCKKHNLECFACKKTAMKVSKLTYTKIWDPEGQIFCGPCYVRKNSAPSKERVLASLVRRKISKDENNVLLVGRKRIYGAAADSVLRLIQQQKETDEPIVVHQFLSSQTNSSANPSDAESTIALDKREPLS